MFCWPKLIESESRAKFDKKAIVQEKKFETSCVLPKHTGKIAIVLVCARKLDFPPPCSNMERLLEPCYFFFKVFCQFRVNILSSWKKTFFSAEKVVLSQHFSVGVKVIWTCANFSPVFVFFLESFLGGLKVFFHWCIGEKQMAPSLRNNFF